jgi:DNA-binding protein HU
MNKVDLVKTVTTKLQGMSVDATQKNTQIFIEAFLDTIEETLLRGEDVRLVNFGTFSMGTRKAHQGVVPKTGEIIQVPERSFVKFKPGKFLKEKILKI